MSAPTYTCTCEFRISWARGAGPGARVGLVDLESRHPPFEVVEQPDHPQPPLPDARRQDRLVAAELADGQREVGAHGRAHPVATQPDGADRRSERLEQEP